MKAFLQQYPSRCTFIVVSLLTALIYMLGVSGPFLLDDAPNLGPIAVDGGIKGLDDVLRYVFGPQGGDYKRFIARLSFILNTQVWPVSPVGLKITNVVIHLLIGGALLLLLRRILPYWVESPVQCNIIALLCVALWLVHPLHVSTILYVVQRMTQLMMLFTILSIHAYFCFEQQQSIKKAFSYLLLSGFYAILGFFSKENAATLLALIPLIVFLKPKAAQNQPLHRYSFWLAAAMAAVFSALFIFMMWIPSIGNFEGRVFSMTERVLLQGKILADYLTMLVFPIGQSMTLFHDDREWMVDINGLGIEGWYWTIHLGLVALAIAVRKKAPLISLGILWFYLSHVIESSVIPLELMFEHRNYLPSAGVCLIAAWGLLLAYQQLKSHLPDAAGVICFALPVVLLMMALGHRAALWSDYKVLIHKWSYEHPLSLRANYSYILVLEQNGFPDKAMEMLVEVQQRFNDLSLDLLHIKIRCGLDYDAEAKPIVDIKTIPKRTFTSGVSTAMNDLIAFPDEACLNRQIVGGDLEDLIDAIGENEMIQRRARYRAQYLDFAGKYYQKQRDYLNTVRAREKIFQIQPSTSTALKTAELFLLGGDATNALDYIAKAKAIDERRWFNDSKVDNDIKVLEDLALQMAAKLENVDNPAADKD